MKMEYKDANAVTEYIFMYSGTKVQLDGEGCPTLHDIAVHCGRIPRFAGATKGWWSVLHHLLAAEMVADIHCGTDGMYSPGVWNSIRLTALLHDAHEAPTGDIPSPFKPPFIREFQQELDQRLYKSLGLNIPDPGVQELVHRIDRALLGKEGELLGPPGDDWYVDVENEFSDFAESTIQHIQERYPDPMDTIDPNGFAVQDFEDTANKLVISLT